jgi:hypothetical protein
MNRPEQDFIAEGFVQKVNRAGSQGARPRRGIAMAGDEDDRNQAMGRSQLLLQLQAAHPRHPQVDDQAGRGLPLTGMQKVLR